MNKLSLVLLFAAMSSLFACNKSDNAPSNSASVKFVNGCAGVPGADVKVNGAAQSGAQNVLFQHASDYQYLTAGTNVNIAFYITNLGTKLISQGVALYSGSHYSVFAGGIITAPTFLLTSDDLSAPSSSSAKIRVVNLSSDGLSLTATAGTNSFATNVTSNSASDFAGVTAGQYVIKAGDPSKLSTIVSTGSVTLAAGKIYTLIYTGSESGSGASGLNVTLMNNN